MVARVVVRPDPEAVALEATRLFVDLALESVQARGRFGVALAGGSTPAKLYGLLASAPFRHQVPWDQVHIFWGDERCVPPDDLESNYWLAHKTLISQVPLPPGNVHRVVGTLDPEEAASDYERTLRAFLSGSDAQLDLILLGLGDDGHTASLFPGASSLRETERMVIPVQASYQDRPAHRVTLTLPVINASRCVLFLVTGRAKARIVRTVLHDPERVLPAQLVQPASDVVYWLVDAAAARLLAC